MKKEYYKRNLPHFQTRGQTFFVTWIVANAIPKKVLEKLASDNEEKKLSGNKWQNNFYKIDKLLAIAENNSDFLKNPKLADIVAETMKYWDKRRINLYAFTIMPNHVHAVMHVNEKDENGNPLFLSDIMESIKKFSARECNKVFVQDNFGNMKVMTIL